MTFRKKLLTAAVGSALGVTSPATFAAAFCLNENSSCGNVTEAIKFAEEIKADDASDAYIPAIIPSATNDLTEIQSKLAWGFNVDQAMYLRLDLTLDGSAGKVKFEQDPQVSASIGDFAIPSGPVSPTEGGVGYSYAIYKFENIGTAVLPTDVVTFEFKDTAKPAFKINSVGGNIELTYSIGTNNTLKPSSSLQKSSAAIIQFESSFEFESNTQEIATADVESNFIKFIDDRSTDAIGQFTFQETGSDIYAMEVGGATGTTVTISTVLSTDTSLDVVGDFTMTEETPGSADFTNARSKVYLHKMENSETACAEADILSNEVTSEKATFTSFNGVSGSYYVCVTGNGSSIVEGDYNLVLNAKGRENTDDTGSDKSASYSVPGEITLSEVGKIERNGTQLITPYITVTDGYISRIILSNTGAADASYTAQIISDDGNAVSTASGATGTVKAGTNLQIDAADSGKDRPYLVDSFSTKQRGAVLFTFIGANSDIQGVYQTVNIANAEVQTIIMQRPGGGNGRED
jgi:hypothetical protein